MMLSRLLILGLPLLVAACSHEESPAVPPVRPVRLMTVGNADTSSDSELAAVVKARVESRMGFRVAGKIAGRTVEIGQHVVTGQPLLRLDPRDYALAELSGKSGLTAALAHRDVVKSEYERFQALQKQGFVSRIDLDRKHSELIAAEAQVRSAQSNAELAGNQVGDTVLKADADGVVEAIAADVGEVVAAGQPVVTLAHDGEREVEVEFPEDRTRLASEAHARVRLWSHPDQPYPASLREISAAADPVTRTFKARYQVQAPGSSLILGQSASLLLHRAASTAPGIVQLPTSALLEANGVTLVWVFDPKSGLVRRQPVKAVGVSGNDVLAMGLQPGTAVVTAGVHVLADGQKVRPLDDAGAEQPHGR